MAKPIPKKKKALSYAKLKKKLDVVFSKYIRTVYADRNGNVACISCHVRKPIKQMQNGHFESRTHLSLRWSELNCHPQCYRCNCILSGNYRDYSRAMIQKYGVEILERLNREKHLVTKFSTMDLFLMIEKYKGLTKAREQVIEFSREQAPEA